jgi:hypothetical protein
MLRRLIGSAGLLLLLSGTTFPAATGTVYTHYGHGMQSCGSWLQARKEPGRTDPSYIAWLSGYMTAFNRWRADEGNIASDTDMAGLIGWIDNFCRREPLDTISDAAEALLFELMRRSKSGASRPEPRNESIVHPTYRKQITDRLEPQE